MTTTSSPFRYLVFTFSNFYPGGGMSDWLCSLDTPEEVYNALERNYSNHTISPSIDQVQIFDTATNTLITKDVLGDEFFSDKNSTWESYLKSSF